MGDAFRWSARRDALTASQVLQGTLPAISGVAMENSDVEMALGAYKQQVRL